MLKTQTELKKGCGKEFYEEGNPLDEPTICGCYDKWGTETHLCPTCQALLQYSNEIIEEIDKLPQIKEFQDIKGHVAKMQNKYIRVDLIKSSIIGSKEKTKSNNGGENEK